MIKITIWCGEKGYKGFEVLGHSGYADIGSDIVCAGVSAVAQTAVNMATEVLNLDFMIDLDAKAGKLKCILEETTYDGAPNEVGNNTDLIVWEKTVQALKATFCILAEQYPENIRINEMTDCH